MRTDTRRRWALLTGVVLLVACRQDMHDQAKYEPLEASQLFADGAASRPIPSHTVARGWLEEDRTLATGLVSEGIWTDALPLPLTPELLARGRQRFEIYCSPCHDRTGSGRGMIVQRGFTAPPAYWEPRLLAKPVGYFFDVATNGYGQMSGYRSQVPTDDRWAIAAWVRVLQRAHTVEAAGLSDEERRYVDEGHRVGGPVNEGGGHESGSEHEAAGAHAGGA